LKFTICARSLFARGRIPVGAARAKPTVTHRSKKNCKLTWSGRGFTQRWMHAEMKALKLKPDAFLIRKQ